jgi:hypothetical protein
MEAILNLLSTDSYLSLNINLCKVIGLNQAIVLTKVISYSGTTDDWVSVPVEVLKYETSLTKHQQTRAFDDLAKRGIIEIKYSDYPRTRFVKILKNGIENIMELLSDNPQDKNYTESVEIDMIDFVIETLKPPVNTSVAPDLTTDQSPKPPVNTSVAPDLTTEEDANKEKEEKEKKEKKEKNQKKEKKEKNKEEKESTRHPKKFERHNESYKFAEWFYQNLLSGWHKDKVTEADKQAWAKCYSTLQAKGYTKQTIVEVCEWAKKDDFWSTNFYTPCKLARKSKNLGILYIDKFIEDRKRDLKTREYNGG